MNRPLHRVAEDMAEVLDGGRGSLPKVLIRNGIFMNQIQEELVGRPGGSLFFFARLRA